MAITSLLSLVAFIVLIGAGMLLAAIGIILTIILVGISITACSILIGWYKKSWVTGWRAFIIQNGIATGAVAGSVTLWISTIFWPLISDSLWILALGGGAGALIGGCVFFILGESIQKLLQPLSKWASTRITYITS